MIPVAYITEWQAQVPWPDGYDADLAANTIMERLVSLLRNAPCLHQIANGEWRQKH